MSERLMQWQREMVRAIFGDADGDVVIDWIEANGKVGQAHVEVIDRQAAELVEATKLLADCVAKCTEYGSQDGGFVANYIMPTGPIHRAIPWLAARGVHVRPGSNPPT